MISSWYVYMMVCGPLSLSSSEVSQIFISPKAINTYDPYLCVCVCVWYDEERSAETKIQSTPTLESRQLPGRLLHMPPKSNQPTSFSLSLSLLCDWPTIIYSGASQDLLQCMTIIIVSRPNHAVSKYVKIIIWHIVYDRKKVPFLGAHSTGKTFFIWYYIYEGTLHMYPRPTRELNLPNFRCIIYP